MKQDLDRAYTADDIPAVTANLQSRPGLTVKQIAKLMNVSERMIYMARKVSRLRPDLKPEIAAGRMSLNEAHRLVTGKTKPTSWVRLVKAWNNATDDDRDRLVFLILGWKRE